MRSFSTARYYPSTQTVVFSGALCHIFADGSLFRQIIETCTMNSIHVLFGVSITQLIAKRMRDAMSLTIADCETAVAVVLILTQSAFCRYQNTSVLGCLMIEKDAWSCTLGRSCMALFKDFASIQNTLTTEGRFMVHNRGDTTEGRLALQSIID